MIIYEESKAGLNILDYYTTNVSFASFACALAYIPHNQRTQIIMNNCLFTGPNACDGTYNGCIYNSSYNLSITKNTYNNGAYPLNYYNTHFGPIVYIFSCCSRYNEYVCYGYNVINNSLILFDIDKNPFEAILCYYVSTSSSYGGYQNVNGVCIGGTGTTGVKLTYKFDGTNYIVCTNTTQTFCSTSYTNFTNINFFARKGCMCASACVDLSFSVWPYCWETVCGNIYYKCK